MNYTELDKLSAMIRFLDDVILNRATEVFYYGSIFVCHHTLESANFDPRLSCSTEIDGQVVPENFGFRKNFSLGPLEIILMKMHEMGFSVKMMRKYGFSGEKTREISKWKPLSMMVVHSPGVYVSCAYGVACAWLILEVILHLRLQFCFRFQGL